MADTPVPSKHNGIVEPAVHAAAPPHLQVPLSQTLSAVKVQYVDVPQMQAPPSHVNPVPQFLLAHGSVIIRNIGNFFRLFCVINGNNTTFNENIIITKRGCWSRGSSRCCS